jgi:hypothetical protein
MGTSTQRFGRILMDCADINGTSGSSLPGIKLSKVDMLGEDAIDHHNKNGGNTSPRVDSTDIFGFMAMTKKYNSTSSVGNDLNLGEGDGENQEHSPEAMNQLILEKEMAQIKGKTFNQMKI